MFLWSVSAAVAQYSGTGSGSKYNNSINVIRLSSGAV